MKQKQLNIIFLICGIFFSFISYAQIGTSTFELNGQVRDANNGPMNGVTISNKNQGNGTLTNDDGKFTLEVKVGDTLIFTSLGFESKEIEVLENKYLTIVLNESTSELNEIVVVGYGTVKRKDLTGSIGTIEGSKLIQQNKPKLSTSLQGLVPGLRATKNSSIPGDNSAELRVRGITTLGNSSPLILLDGVPIDNIDIVNPNDIEDISVLKDASTASIYGSRAAAGVILITTKQAKEGQLSLDYSGSVSFGKPTRFPGKVGIKRYMEMINEVAWNDGGNQSNAEFTEYSEDLIKDYEINNETDPIKYPIFDWEKELLDKKYSHFTKHGLTMNYGNEVIKLLGSFNYDYADALYKGKNEERISARLNSNYKINKFLTFKASMLYLHSINKSPITNPIPMSYHFPAIEWPPYWPDGRTAPGRVATNPWASLNYGGSDDSFNNQFIGNFSLMVEPLKGLRINASLMPQTFNSQRKNFVKKVQFYESFDSDRPDGLVNGNNRVLLDEYRPSSKDLTKQLLIEYGLNFGVNRFDLLFGYEDGYNYTETFHIGSKDLALNDFPYLDRANITSLLPAGNAKEFAYNSYFGRLKYNYKEKYFIESSIRLDGSSRFTKNRRWGSFPSFAVAWIATEEDFFQNLELNWLDYFKVRLSYGSLGNDRIGEYPYQPILNFKDVLMYNNGSILANTGASQNKFNIPDITWETTKVWNLGLDVNFFEERLLFKGDFYGKKTKDMLLPIEIPKFLGFENPEQNAGDMNTKGFEVSLSWADKVGELGYSIGFNLSDYKSIMGNLSGTVFTGDQIVKEGYEYNAWYGYISDGLFQSDDDISKSALFTSSVRPGDVKYKDVRGSNGEPDGKITPDQDKVILGGSQPRMLYGANLGLNYKGIDLNIVFQGVGKVLDRLESNQVYQTVQWYNFPDFIDGNYFSEYNTPEKNKNARFPRLSQAGFLGNNYEMSDFWLIDGSYFRLKNVSLGYSFSDFVIKKLGLSALRIYLAGSNLFSIDHYPKGWDPEAALNSYIQKEWTIGLSIKF